MSSLLENSIIVESTKKFSVFSLEEEIERIEQLSNGDSEDKIEEETVASVSVDGRMFWLDEEVKEDDNYKWYEIIDGEKVKRNNTDPDLTPDGLLSVEAQIKQLEEKDIENIKELSEDELVIKHNKEILQRIKCIALDAMGKNILSDPKNLSPREKRDFIRRIEELLILSEEEIKMMFGNICHETIYQSGADYSKYCVYDV